MDPAVLRREAHRQRLLALFLGYAPEFYHARLARDVDDLACRLENDLSERISHNDPSSRAARRAFGAALSCREWIAAHREGRWQMPSLLDDAEHWRSRAEEARTMADRMKDLEVRRTMLEIATMYDGLAERAEQRSKSNV